MIYLDHAATTPIDSGVKELLIQELEYPANASSVHRHGQQARAKLEKARAFFAEELELTPQEVIFTSSATEANNLAIKGFLSAKSVLDRKVNILSSPLEHSCIKEALNDAERRQLIELEMMTCSETGQAQIPQGASPDFLALMYTQNETGTIQNLEQARALKDRSGCFWLCDITQSFLTENIKLPELGADLISMSSHKLYGPSGVGLLAGKGVKNVHALLHGGPQEHELRAGTQPVALAVAFAEAARQAIERRKEYRKHLLRIENSFWTMLNESDLTFHQNCAKEHHTPGFINLSIPSVDGADLVIGLDARGFSISSGSACATGVMEPSGAIACSFNDEDRIRGAIRITPGRKTTEKDITQLAEGLIELGKALGKN